ncbi:uncharacterized protein METZ01_LOCUS484009, partial [marine metagenome]
MTGVKQVDHSSWTILDAMEQQKMDQEFKTGQFEPFADGDLGFTRVPRQPMTIANPGKFNIETGR